MGGAELHTRATQELSKYSDLIQWRLGLNLGADELPPSARRRGIFFWDPSEMGGRVALLCSHLPCEVSAIVTDADALCRHSFRLLGYEALDFGTPIDWHLDPVHQKRAALRPWFRVPFLDFDEVGDHKVIWELNRHQHLLTLAKAWAITSDERYLNELKTQWNAWQESNPYPLGINWASSLEVAFRTLSWIWIEQLLRSAGETQDFRQALIAGIAFHSRYIERFLSTYFSPNTHLLGELVALFFVGTLYPDLVGAERWRTLSWRALCKEAEKQVRPDGVYFEQSLYYHVYALDFFFHARRLAHLNGVPIPIEFDAVLQKMLAVVQALTQAGLADGFGDDDGGRVFDPRRNRAEHMADPLALGALQYDLPPFPSARLTQESIWLFGETATKQLLESSAPTTELGSHAFPDGGVYVIAGSALHDDQIAEHQLNLDAGPQGEASCGHGHADALSLRLTIAGKRWLVDPGTGVYMDSDRSIRNAFRGTAAHNTLRVDNTDQAVALNPFAWTSIPQTRTNRWIAATTFRFQSAAHDGYQRLSDPVLHQRTVFALAEGGWLVRDQALGSGSHDLELNWHFGPGIELLPGQEGVKAHASDSAIGLRILFAGSAAWQQETLESEYSPAYGCIQKAPVLRYRTRAQVPTEIATALTLENGALAEEPQLRSQSHDRVQTYQLQSAQMIHSFFFAERENPWRAGPWASDAEFLYCRTEGQILTHLVLLSGSYVRFQDSPVLQAGEPIDWLEWRTKDGKIFADSNNRIVPQIEVGRSFATTNDVSSEPIFSTERP